MKNILTLEGNRDPEAYLHALYAAMEDGAVRIARYDDGGLMGCMTTADVQSATCLEVYRLREDAPGLDDVLAEGRALVASLKAAAAVDASAIGSRAAARRALSPQLFAVWNVYLRPFVWQGAERARVRALVSSDDYLLHCAGDGRFSAEEEALLARYEAARMADYADRLRGRFGAAQLVCRAMRLEKLFELDAPAMIADNETREVYEALALSRCAAAVRRIGRRGERI